MKPTFIWICVLAAVISTVPALALDQVCEGEICYHQPEHRVTFLLNETCTVGGSLQACIDTLKSALDVWNTPECSDMELSFGGTTPRIDIGYSQENPDDNINLIYVMKTDWPHAPTNPRVSTMAYDSQSGAIIDYDIEVNNHHIGLEEVGFHNLLARDFGMALGFDKDSGDANSIMRVSSGGVKKVLSNADVEALCQLYPNPGDPDLPTSGCSCGVSSTKWHCLLFVLALIIALLRGAFTFSSAWRRWSDPRRARGAGSASKSCSP